MRINLEIQNRNICGDPLKIQKDYDLQFVTISIGDKDFICGRDDVRIIISSLAYTLKDRQSDDLDI